MKRKPRLNTDGTSGDCPGRSTGSAYSMEDLKARLEQVGDQEPSSRSTGWFDIVEARVETPKKTMRKSVSALPGGRRVWRSQITGI